MKYSIEFDPEKSARAYGRELHISPKHCENIARAIKGMKVKDAKKYLEDVINLKRPIPFKTHNRERAHKKGMGPGGYPEKACREILKVIKNAENNAEYKGMDPEEMYIAHISTYRGRIIRGYMPRAFGRSTAWNERTTNVEIIIAEREEEEEG
jgi:large subunit ribosomal protein L22